MWSDEGKKKREGRKSIHGSIVLSGLDELDQCHSLALRGSKWIHPRFSGSHTKNERKTAKKEAATELLKTTAP